MSEPTFAMGWVDDQAAVNAALMQMEHEAGHAPTYTAWAEGVVRDSGDDESPVLHWKAEAAVLGGVRPSWNQGQVGTCVSFGFGRGAQDLMLMEIASGEDEEWPGAEVATEPIYAGSRVEVGGGRIRGDGSVGAWAARWVKDWGILLRKQYGPHDLRTYSESVSRDWGQRGCPDDLEGLAREHPVRTVALVSTEAEAWAAVGNLNPIPICSSQGFTTQLVGGFCEPRGTWMHCMLVRGRFVHPQRGRSYVIQNSWGGYLTGERRVQVRQSDGMTKDEELPEGCFCTTAATMAGILSQRDSFAMSAFTGFPRRPDSVPWLI